MRWVPTTIGGANRPLRAATAVALAVTAATVTAWGTAGCAPADGSLPVVARGRYVEIATLRDEPICGGTARYFDRFIERGYALLGEVPPERRFVRFEWLEEPERPESLNGEGHARKVGDEIILSSDRELVHEHELAHAVHFASIGPSNSFLNEGFAVLLDSKRLWVESFEWPAGRDLDAILGSTRLGLEDYHLAWFLVSQIVRDHGFEGFVALSRAVPHGSSAAEVREAYQATFGRPIDALIEPIEFDDPVYGHYEEERGPCNFSLCLAEPEALVDGAWDARGPSDCEDDPEAVGPDRRAYLSEFGDVWHDHVLSTGDAGRFDMSLRADTAMTLRPCWLDCEDVGNGSSEFGFQAEEFWLGGDRTYRVEVRASLDDLPTQDPGTLHFEAVSPY